MERFLEMTQVEDDLPDTASQHAFLRSALDKDWASLWVSGRLNILDSDYLHAAVRKIGSYLRRKRNPLVDRQSFHGRDQANGESIDQYFSALSWIHNACDFEDGPGCTSCGQACSHGVVIANTRLRDRLICGLFDKGMQRRVLEEQYDTSLSLERVLQVCSAYESSKNTESTLGEVGDAPTNDIAAAFSPPERRPGCGECNKCRYHPLSVLRQRSASPCGLQSLGEAVQQVQQDRAFCKCLSPKD